MNVATDCCVHNYGRKGINCPRSLWFWFWLSKPQLVLFCFVWFSCHTADPPKLLRTHTKCAQSVGNRVDRGSPVRTIAFLVTPKISWLKFALTVRGLSFFKANIANGWVERGIAKVLLGVGRLLKRNYLHIAVARGWVLQAARRLPSNEHAHLSWRWVVMSAAAHADADLLRECQGILKRPRHRFRDIRVTSAEHNPVKRRVLKDLRWCIRHHSSVEKSTGLNKFGLFAGPRFDSGRNPVSSNQYGFEQIDPQTRILNYCFQ